MKKVPLEFVLKRLLVDPVFFHAASGNLDTALTKCEYTVADEDKAYIKSLLRAKLGTWPTRTIGDLMRYMHSLTTTYAGSFEPYPEKVARGLPIGPDGPVWVIKPSIDILPVEQALAKKSAVPAKRKPAPSKSK